MRLRRLILGRYGHLSDTEIAFGDSPGLHIVLGANEAGKSTALSAIGDCLFRFPHRTQYDFLHASRDLRIGVTLRARDGREDTFFRRKARKDDLFDARDQPVPESAILAFLAGATRERFDRVFGLNGTELRQGGDAILKGHGEAGEAILGAHTGLHGYRDLLTRLDSDAARLFGDRRGQRAFHKASERYLQARQERDERRVDPAAWKQVREQLAALEQARVNAIERTRTLHAERSRLDRIRRTTPARMALARLRAERQALGPVPALPDDADEQARQAIAGRDQAARDQARERERLAGLAAERDALPEAAPVLDCAAAIDMLADDRQRIAGALKDRDTQRLVAAQCAEAMREEGGRLGLALDAEALAARIPSALDRETVAQALRLQARLSGQQATRRDQREAAEEKLADARAALAAMTLPQPHAELRGVIEAVRAEGRLDEEMAEADRVARAAAADLARRVAALPLWHGDAASLAAAPVPMEAEIQRLTDRLAHCAADVQGCHLHLAEHERALADHAAQALAEEAAGPLPTLEAIRDARQRRDAAWALIRRTHLQGEPAAGVSPVTGAAFEALISAADHLADRRSAEQARVVAAEQRRAEQIRRQALRDADEGRCREAMARRTEAWAEWQALWRPCGLEPSEPAAMREWMQQRALVLAGYRAWLDTGQVLERLQARHASSLGALATLLPAEAAAASGSLGRLLRAAESLCKAREAQAAQLERMRANVEAAEAERAKADRAMARAEAEWGGWRDAWGKAAQTLSLPPAASHDLGAAALTLWEVIDTANRQRRDAGHRVAEMTLAIEAFRQEADRVVRLVAPELAESDALEAVSLLAQRLATARQEVRRRHELAGQIAAAQEALGVAERQQRLATEMLTQLRIQARVTDDAGLRDAIARSALHRELSRGIADRDAELAKLDDGKTLQELAAEAEGVEFDSLPASIAAVDAELGLLQAAGLADHETRLRLQQAQAAMEQGRDAAAAAQAMEGALAEMDEVAARYVPLRMAHMLLRAGIERFRRQQQGPLLLRAGQVFARLTEGRYDRLEVDEKDNGDVFVVACQPDGMTCPADRLSEGTLDQLYLALRLAAIEVDSRASEPLPFIGDDLLVNFDDRRARTALRVLGEFAEKVTQVILFTHHEHIAALADPDIASVHRLARSVAVT